MTNPEPRDVIARVSFDDESELWAIWVEGAPAEQFDSLPDAILAALDAAGYDVVKRDQPLPPTPGPYNPFGKQDGE